MNRKLLAVLAMVLIAVMFLAACRGGTTPEVPAGPETTPDSGVTVPEESTGPVRGVWVGNVYTNGYLGFRFTMPEVWSAATDAELADLMGVFEGALPDLMEEFTVFYEMVATSPTGASIQVIIERMEDPALLTLTEAELIEMMVPYMEQMGVILDVNSPVTRIGRYDWHSYRTSWAGEAPIEARIPYGQQFIMIRDGFVHYIIFSFGVETESVAGMLAMFGDLGA